MDWGDNIEHIIMKVSSGSYAIRTVKMLLSVEKLRRYAYGINSNAIWVQMTL